MSFLMQDYCVIFHYIIPVFVLLGSPPGSPNRTGNTKAHHFATQVNAFE